MTLQKNYFAKKFLKILKNYFTKKILKNRFTETNIKKLKKMILQKIL